MELMQGSTEVMQHLDPEEARGMVDPALQLMVGREPLRWPRGAVHWRWLFRTVWSAAGPLPSPFGLQTLRELGATSWNAISQLPSPSQSVVRGRGTLRGSQP
jgi:hypothetical protein